MIKIRWMGTPEDLKWFRQHLEEDKEIRLQNRELRLKRITAQTQTWKLSRQCLKNS